MAGAAEEARYGTVAWAGLAQKLAKRPDEKADAGDDDEAEPVERHLICRDGHGKFLCLSIEGGEAEARRKEGVKDSLRRDTRRLLGNAEILRGLDAYVLHRARLLGLEGADFEVAQNRVLGGVENAAEIRWEFRILVVGAKWINARAAVDAEESVRAN